MSKKPIALPAPPSGIGIPGLTPLVGDQLTYLSKLTGGIPDFAQELLIEKGGMDRAEVEAADKAGRKKP
jgi:hypothetical protein